MLPYKHESLSLLRYPRTYKKKPYVMVHACNLNSVEAERRLGLLDNILDESVRSRFSERPYLKKVEGD